MKPEKLSVVINRRRYSTSTATLIAGNDWWDGHNYERSGRQTYLYRTTTGRYFFTIQTCWAGEVDRIRVASLEEAIDFFEGVPSYCCRVDYETAFPGVSVEDA